MEFKDYLIENGAKNKRNYNYKGNSLVRKPIEKIVANSMLEYLINNDMLSLPMAEQQYAEILEEANFVKKKDIFNLPKFCFPSVNHEIKKLNIQYSTIIKGINKFIQENINKNIEFKVKLITNYEKSKEMRYLRPNTSVAFLNQEKFEDFIRNNIQIKTMIKAIFNFPEEFTLPKKTYENKNRNS